MNVAGCRDCVANLQVKGNQMMVTWHVDDVKVSHVDPNEVTKFLVYMGKIYGPKMKVTRGKVHDYLGMDLDFSTPGTLRVSMIKYLKKVLANFPELICSISASPAADHLFDIHEDSESRKLPEEHAVAFHHTVAQLLFLCRRARPDIQRPVSFVLCTRVQKPDEDNWGKLKKCLKYLKGTLYMKMNLTADGLNDLRWWVDASYGAQWDSKGHTGMRMSL